MKICFLGNMNNFPYGISKELHARGFQVTQYIDVPATYQLDRPESTDDALANNYPDWIVDLHIDSYHIRNTLYLLFPTIFYRSLIRRINQYDVVFLNSCWIRLGKFIPSNKLVIGLLAGTEIDSADLTRLPKLVEGASQKSGLNRLIPRFVYRYLYGRIFKLQRAGLRRLDIVNYYLPGVYPAGDAIIEEIKKGQHYTRMILRGFDTSLFTYTEPNLERDLFVILNITRFCFTPDVNDNKRNDIMLRGIASFVNKNKITHGLKIVFFEKGIDLELAKKMCRELDIERFIEWCPLVPMERLMDYFADCDVAFDQLGDQWVGSGLFSMLAGRPLIANGRGDLYEKHLGERIPICQASNEEEVCEWLTRLYHNKQLVKEIGLRSHDYVLKHYDIRHNIEFYIHAMEEFLRKKEH